MHHYKLGILLPLFIIALVACKSGGSDPAQPPPQVTVKPGIVTFSWLPNRESRVNAAGGGYLVYIRTTPGTTITPSLNDADFNVPYTLTSVQSSLSIGTYYFQVFVYAEFEPGITTYSKASQEFILRVAN